MYFHLFSPIAVPANLLLVPGASLVVVLGALSLLAGPFSFSASVILNRTSAALIHGMTGLVRWLGSVPGGHFHVAGFPIWLWFLWYVPVATAAVPVIVTSST